MLSLRGEKKWGGGGITWKR